MYMSRIFCKEKYFVAKLPQDLWVNDQNLSNGFCQIRENDIPQSNVEKFCSDYILRYTPPQSMALSIMQSNCYLTSSIERSLEPIEHTCLREISADRMKNSKNVLLDQHKKETSCLYQQDNIPPYYSDPYQIRTKIGEKTAYMASLFYRKRILKIVRAQKQKPKY